MEEGPQGHTGSEYSTLREEKEALSAEVIRLETSLATTRALFENANNMLRLTLTDQQAQREHLAEREDELRMIRAEMTTITQRAEQYFSELKRLRTVTTEQQADNARLVAEITNCRRVIEQARASGTSNAADTVSPSEARIRQELVGLGGSFRNVVFMFDKSDSMKSGGRWEEAKRTAKSWLQYLPVEAAAFVAFSSIPDAYPDDTQLEQMTESARKSLVDKLDSIRPGGSTNIHTALRRAFAYENVDAIVLFTDGRPNASASEGPSNTRDTEQIYSLIKEYRQSHPTVRIHTIGVGDYFSPPMREFLLKVKDLTDGSFLGR